MKKTAVAFGKGFKVLLGNRRVQAAQMVIGAGEAEGGATNRHRSCDQWLYVESGTGVAIIGGRRIALQRHALVLIEHGEHHEIRNTGKALLKTLNFYSPPGYTASGNELPAAKP